MVNVKDAPAVLKVYRLHADIDVCTCMELDWYLWYSVLAFRSSMSMVGKPEISSSSSCSVKMEISLLGMIS